MKRILLFTVLAVMALQVLTVCHPQKKLRPETDLEYIERILNSNIKDPKPNPERQMVEE